MPKAKIIRFELPTAKLLKFNRNGKSIPTVPERDEFLGQLRFVRQYCSDAEWTMLRTHLVKAQEHQAAAVELINQQLERWEHNGGTAS